MAKQLIPKLTPEMLKKQPDQTVALLNRLIQVVNDLQK